MKTLTDALLYHFRGLYDSDTKIQVALPGLVKQATSAALKGELAKYQENMTVSQNKLRWAFEYMGKHPRTRVNKIIRDLLDETLSMLTHISTSEVRDAILIGSIQTISHYRISVYGTCRAFAHELRLHNVDDILIELLAMEKKSDQELSNLAVESINKKAFEVSTLKNIR